MPANDRQRYLSAGLVEVASTQRPATPILQTSVDRHGIQRETISSTEHPRVDAA